MALIAFDGDATVGLALRDPNGVVLSRASLQLPANGNRAAFLNTLDWIPLVDLSLFSGSVTLSSEEGFTALLLRQNDRIISTFPLARLDDDTTRVPSRWSGS